MVDDLHPARYPIHADDAKGQVFGGECNRTACKAHGAVWFNTQTRGLYCQRDAFGINDGPMGAVCIRVDRKPTLEEMDRLYDEFWSAWHANSKGEG